ncbi:flavodoxin family protein [Leadbettera azotonutricia]|uniref:Multimeric flavodoxin n=1 Tax=Leadbettera azotonutricia (strain ATCC BAA-888 / DSM 13862 / ZAS-9) TaxID=545695 RepID=F5YG85_LEAAZ|nr:flavodoxin family protein [Leadbettera azotonutricia]AEF81396.1 multimeric flavodoxin [Leadbettera azotonutricia ZAS-9]
MRQTAKIIGINGSPRKGWSTHVLVEEALKGAATEGAETELVNLYDLQFKGCISCFECKRKAGPSLGRCAVKDDIKPLLDRIDACDGLILGSPIYVGEVTASVRAFIERLTFQYITYRKDRKSFFPRRIPVKLIYTMNIPASAVEPNGYGVKFRFYEDLFARLIGPAETLLSTETWQTTDYGKYEMTMFDGDERKKRRETVFPEDKRKAFEMGAGILGR